MADLNSRSGASYATPAISDYLASVHCPPDSVSQRAFDLPLESGVPAIQLGVHEAAFLGWLLRAARATRAVEVGTLVGFSGLAIARALGPTGRLTTIELDPHRAELARSVFAQAGVHDRVDIRVGDAHAILRELAGPVDAVFLDADKGGYLDYATWAAEHLVPGGLLVADNVFLFGRLLDTDSEAASVRQFHEFVAARFDSVIVPTPDGLLVGARR